jgi:hypothetical protein
MKKEINLYNAENELLEAHATKVFRSSPTLDMMVAKGLQQDERYAAAFRAREAARQNCKVGKKHETLNGITPLQMRAIFKKDYVMGVARLQRQGIVSHKFLRELVGLGDGNECPGSGLCAPAGQRSRKEWCEHGNIISE